MEPREPRKIQTRKTRLSAEADQADREFWAAMTPDERVEETWRLSVELYAAAGINAGESRLDRTVTRLLRR